MTVYLQDPDVTLHHGDVFETLRGMPDGSVDCVVTSPPYWGLRDYGTGLWEGGDPDCDHVQTKARPHSGLPNAGANSPEAMQATVARLAEQESIRYRDVCRKCGAARQDRQLGLEGTPDLFVARMVDVFREVRRVLAAHGTCWVNLGDSYAANRSYQVSDSKHKAHDFADSNAMSVPPGLKPKDLVGIPWRVAFALQADGWYLRADIVWAKPNPMPESVTDRPTKAHEYVFLLTKAPRYWFDQEAVREPQTAATLARYEYGFNKVGKGIQENGASHTKGQGPDGGMIEPNAAGRNIRSVWEIATQPYPEAHFATYPEELVRRCLLAGCPEWVCRVCGKPRERIVKSRSVSRPDLPRDHPEWRPARYDNGKAGDPQAPGPGQRFSETTTLGWSDCGHANYRPGRVLDPFIGSGTTAHVARKHGRHAIGIDLNANYLALAARRLQQQSLFAVDA